VILCDVNVLLYALVGTTPHHDRCSRALTTLLRGPEIFAVSEIVHAAVVRIATHRKIFRPPVAPEVAFEFVEILAQHERSAVISPGGQHWRIFRDLVLATGIRGPDTTDAYLAALAIEHGCEWWTTDDGFRRFPALRWRNLLE
jgi:toxin-antitoxin system PIN domain toxin